MSQAIHVTAGNHAGPRSKRKLEHFETPLCVVPPLIAVEPLPKVCWDPCCGPDANNNIVIGLKAAGKRVVMNDITRDGVDFRTRRKAPRGVEAIVTNPPFSLAGDFVRHGLTLVRKVIVLERIQWLEAEARADLFDAGKLVRIHVFRNRVPRMHRDDWTGKRAGPSMLLCWFVFDREHDSAAPVLDWVRWE